MKGVLSSPGTADPATGLFPRVYGCYSLGRPDTSQGIKWLFPEFSAEDQYVTLAVVKLAESSGKKLVGG
ncbi:MAG TPA: hypothetical protein VF070_39400 [Streptosporangiaceae bacterium]